MIISNDIDHNLNCRTENGQYFSLKTVIVTESGDRQGTVHCTKNIFALVNESRFFLSLNKNIRNIYKK